MIKVKLCLDKRSQKKDGSFPIKIYVSNNRKVFYVNTGFSALENCWINNELTPDIPNFRSKNSRIREMYNQVDDIVLTVERERKGFIIDNSRLKSLIERRLFSDEKDNFLYYLDRFVSTKMNEGTKGLYLATKDKIEKFDIDCNFKTINPDWLQKFENWLKADGIKTNSIGIHLRNIRAVFNYAIDNEFTNLYPFRRFKIKKEETEKRSLTVEELRTIRDYDVEQYQKRYRDLFMLMFYLMGINSVDLFNLPPLDGNTIVYRRAKTNRLYKIKVEPEAMEIIKRYQGKKYMLNVLDEYKNYKDFIHRMNLGLKRIGEVKRSGLGGKKDVKSLFPKISTYYSRHSWATIAASLEIPKETIAEALGHADNSVTSIYIKFDRKKIDIANRKVIDFLNAKNPDTA